MLPLQFKSCSWPPAQPKGAKLAYLARLVKSRRNSWVQILSLPAASAGPSCAPLQTPLLARHTMPLPSANSSGLALLGVHGDNEGAAIAWVYSPDLHDGKFRYVPSVDTRSIHPFGYNSVRHRQSPIGCDPILMHAPRDGLPRLLTSGS
jgi:hypothetical protein